MFGRAGGGCVLFFFFQAEDGIRDLTVTGVQTCALPILASIFIVVVFPAPFGPRRPKISPGSTTRSIPSTARKRSRLSCSRRSRCQIVQIGRASCRERV